MGESENNRRAKYYRLTRAGRRQLEAETESWRRISVAITSALKATWRVGPMPLIPRLKSLRRNLLERDRVDRDLADEIDAYLELLIQAKVATSA